MKNIILSLLILSIFVLGTYAGAWFTQKEEFQKKYHHQINKEQWKNKKNSEPLIVHAIPHSHDDIGWLKTMNDYFYGTLAQNDHAAVQFTIDTYVTALKKDPKRTFNQVEMAFFSMWWFEQDDKTQEEVRQFLKNGQLEMINGGWCQNDEAGTYYENIIENMWIGHRFLKNELNYVPSIGWSIDPFGHSSAQSSMYSQMGFNGWWFSRIDYQDFDKRMKDKGLEMIWNPPQASGKQFPIYTGVNYYHYNSPPNFCFDAFCPQNEPVKDDPRLADYNVEELADELVDYFENMALHYRTPLLLHTFGEDFQWTNSEMFYKNLDRLFKYIREHPEKYNNITIKYSTVGEFLKELNEKQPELPEETYDFFPYADGDNAYWTGYFTSRIAGKGSYRDTAKNFMSQRTWLGLLRYSNASSVLVQDEDFVERALTTMEQAIGVVQHHDAVTGTEKQKVDNNYLWIINNATNVMDRVMNSVLKEQTQIHANINLTTEYHSYNWNSTAINCSLVYDSISNGENMLMSIYNPSLTRKDMISFKVPEGSFDLIDLQSNTTIPVEIVCSDMQNNKNCDAYFKQELKGFALNFFYISANTSPKLTKKLDAIKVDKDDMKFRICEKKNITVSASNEQFVYQFPRNGKNENRVFSINYNYYKSYQGVGLKHKGQKSGAYIFRPSNDTINGSIPYSKIENKQVFNGNIVTIVHLEGDKTSSDIIFKNLNNNTNKVVEIKSYLRSIDIKDKQGKELVLLVKSDIKNEKIFYTDANGLELLERKLNYRPTWKLNVTQPASGNYYNINAMIKIKDTKSNHTLSLLNDRAQGGTSLQEGELELMVNRRMLYDDSRGVGEALNETNRFDDQGLEQLVRHWLVFGSDEDEQSKELPRWAQFQNDLKPLTYFAKLDKLSGFKIKEQKLKLVDNLQEMTKLYVRYYGSQSNAYLMRLHNMKEFNSTLFPGQYKSLKETTLTANQLLEEWENNRMTWKGENGKSFEHSSSNFKNEKIEDIKEKINERRYLRRKEKVEDSNDGPVISKLRILPLELRTFNITAGF